MTQAELLAIAISDFVLGCKADGIWDSIKSCCVMAAWDGLNGCLYPLKGAAPSPVNLTGSDYNRKTGIRGDASSKRIDTKYAIPTLGQNNAHGAVWCSEVMSPLNRILWGNSDGSGFGAYPWTSDSYTLAANTSGASIISITGIGTSTGLFAVNRAGSTAFDYRISNNAGSVSISSTTPLAAYIQILTGVNGSYPSNARVSFYSIGESLDLALLDARVTALMVAIGAAIP